MDIISVIQEKVDEIAREQYAKDPCPPVFIVSLILRYDEKARSPNMK
jgi:hypothetical protein